MAKQLATRDDVTQSILALVFRLMIAMCAAGLLCANASFAVHDISVAFLHSRTDEVAFVHSPKADLFVRPGFCWRLRRAMNRTRRASTLCAEKVKFVFRRAGCLVLRTMSMVFWNPFDRYMLVSFVSIFRCMSRIQLLIFQRYHQSLNMLFYCDLRYLQRTSSEVSSSRRGPGLFSNAIRTPTLDIDCFEHIHLLRFQDPLFVSFVLPLHQLRLDFCTTSSRMVCRTLISFCFVCRGNSSSYFSGRFLLYGYSVFCNPLSCFELALAVPSLSSLPTSLQAVCQLLSQFSLVSGTSRHGSTRFGVTSSRAPSL